MLTVKPECVMGFLVLKPSELVCNELLVVFPQCKGFHLGEAPCNPCRNREVDVGLWKQDPSEHLLTCKIN
jgi:hypothetical protein